MIHAPITCHTRIPGRPALAVALLMAVASPGAGQEETSNLLRPGDEVAIRVWPDSSLSGRYRIETDGHAYLPILGPVPVTGRPVEELREELVVRYSDIMRSPIVVVVPRFRVSVLGGVRGPGLYFVEHPTTLIDVISLAGGFTENAKPDEIRLLRQGQVFGVDAKLALETGAPTAAVPLESGDRIVVPTKGRVDALQIIQTLVGLATLATLIWR